MTNINVRGPVELFASRISPKSICRCKHQKLIITWLVIIAMDEVLNILYLPITFLRKWNVCVFSSKMPVVNTTKDNLTPHLF